MGNAVTLATLDRGAGRRDLGTVEHKAFVQSGFPVKLGRSAEMRDWLAGARDEGFELIHSHGLWMMPNIYPAAVAARAKIPHVVAPRGTLDPAALVYSRHLKLAAWYLGQRRVLQQAAALHATSEEEAGQFRALGFRQPIILLPNGNDMPSANRPPRQARRTLLYLGRLHAKKGLDMLLGAWAELEATYPDWDLRIVGRGTAEFEASLVRDIEALKLRRVRIDGPLYGEEKLRALKAADLFVLPTRGENFGMVVAEAFAAGTPVLTTRGAPWSGIKTHRCGWWTDPVPEAIGAGLSDALSLPSDTLEEMGLRGRAWMTRSYSWDNIGMRMAAAYLWLCHGGSQPQDVLRM